MIIIDFLIQYFLILFELVFDISNFLFNDLYFHNLNTDCFHVFDETFFLLQNRSTVAKFISC